MGIIFFDLRPQKKMRPLFWFLIFLNWDFGLEISHLRKKVFMPTSKMWIRTLYVKRFRSSDLFVFSTLPQRGCFIVEAFFCCCCCYCCNSKQTYGCYVVCMLCAAVLYPITNGAVVDFTNLRTDISNSRFKPAGFDF